MITSVKGSIMACFLAALAVEAAAQQQVATRAPASQPTLLVLVRERFEERGSGTRAAETRLIRCLRDKGFEVADPDQKKLLDLRNRLLAETSGDVQGATRAVTDLNADYLLVGEAAVTSSGPLGDTDLKARYASITLKVIESRSGRVLAIGSGEGKVKHLDELTGGNWALEEAADKVAKDIVAALEKILKDGMASGPEGASGQLAGGGEVRGTTAALQQRYLAEKYNLTDTENAREFDGELLTKIRQLANAREMQEQQKKQLRALREGIEKNRQETYLKQQQFEKRTEELRQAQAQTQELQKTLESAQTGGPAAY